eukprot:jgi/Hompol1/1509/HPOL_000598-RA
MTVHHHDKEFDETGDIIKHELDIEKELLKGGDIEEVDASYASLYTTGLVPETDDPHAPSLTVRMVILGTAWAIALALINGIFSFRTVAFGLPGSAVALLSYPMGIFLARVLPRGILNPGPFTIKEHVLIYIIASSAGGQPYGIDNVVGQYMDRFMGDKNVTFWNSLAWVIATQMIGFGISGMTRRFLVRPAAMFWPTILPTVALFVSFHEEEESEELKKVGGLSRYSFFWVAFTFIFVWEWLPNYFSGSLQAISILCMISTNHFARNMGAASFGTGTGLLSFTFDWNNIGSGVIAAPWWTTANNFIAYVIVAWIAIPCAWKNNSFKHVVEIQGLYQFEDGSNFYPLNSPYLYSSHTGARVNPTKFYNPTDYSLNETKFDTVAPIYFSEGFAISYAMSFAALTGSISHVACWYYKDIVRQTKEMISQVDEAKPDIHNTLMKAYPDVPEWMYLCWLAFWMVIMILVGQFTPFRLPPVWGTLFGAALAVVYLIPIGIIQASTGTQIGLNIITELLMGLILPGQTIYVMSFKSYSYNVMIQALALTYDLKIGHYLHINPIHMVFAQLWGTLVGAVGNTASVWIVQSSFPLGTKDWLYPGFNTFYSAGAIWGAIGPARFFGSSSPYFALNWGYLAGAIFPIVPWILNKVYPHPYWRLININLWVYTWTAGNTQSGTDSQLVASFIFMYLIFTYRHHWWVKYNMVLGSSLDAGTALSILASSIMSIYLPASNSQLNGVDLNDWYCTGQGYDV